jgi:hypothetical protein
LVLVGDIGNARNGVDAERFFKSLGEIVTRRAVTPDQ